MAVVEIRRYANDDEDMVEVCEALEPILIRLNKIEMEDVEDHDNVFDFQDFKDKKEMFRGS